MTPNSRKVRNSKCVESNGKKPTTGIHKAVKVEASSNLFKKIGKTSAKAGTK